MFKKIKSKLNSFIALIVSFLTAFKTALTTRAKLGVAGTKAEAYVDTGVKILIAVVVGALILALCYGLFNDTIMPTVTQGIEELFEYAG